MGIIKKENSCFSRKNSQNTNRSFSLNKSHNMKGQVFVAGAIAILAIIAIIVVSLKYSNPEYDRFFDRELDNLDREFRFASFLNKSSVKDLSNYLQTDISGFSAFYVFSDHNSGVVKLTVGNFLKSKTAFSVKSNQFNYSGELENNQSIDLQFNEDGLINLYVSYYADSVLNNELIVLREGRTVFVDFMIKNKDFARRKSIYYMPTIN